jgi:hypothetical protein
MHEGRPAVHDGIPHMHAEFAAAEVVCLPRQRQACMHWNSGRAVALPLIWVWFSSRVGDRFGAYCYSVSVRTL